MCHFIHIGSRCPAYPLRRMQSLYQLLIDPINYEARLTGFLTNKIFIVHAHVCVCHYDAKRSVLVIQYANDVNCGISVYCYY